jgi:hypothetical protein
MLSEDPSPAGHILLINAQGRETKILNAEIDERKPSRVSIMPEKLQEGLTAEEFRDLVEFLSSLR